MKISGILFCVIATAGVIFFGSGQEYIMDFGAHLFFVSLFLYIPGIFLIYKHYKNKNRKRLRVLREPIQRFKKKAAKKTIDLAECRLVPAHDACVTGNNRSLDYRLNFHDSLYSKEFLTNELTDETFHLLFEEADKCYVSSGVPLEESEITEELRVKKYTTLYVDEANPNRYYFDIEFLEA